MAAEHSLFCDGCTGRGLKELPAIAAAPTEVHLSRVYRKLGIRSRAELGNRLASRR